MSHFVGAGNQADLETFDYVRYLLDDPDTDAIAVYVEGFKSPAKFIDTAEIALEREKPIAILKIGRCELSEQAALGHTGSLVGSDDIFDAICRQKGIARADDFDSLIAISSVVLACSPPGEKGSGSYPVRALLSGSSATMPRDPTLAFRTSRKEPNKKRQNGCPNTAR
jgi:acyl-CoA synthetase (NDP forming)